MMKRSAVNENKPFLFVSPNGLSSSACNAGCSNGGNNQRHTQQRFQSTPLLPDTSQVESQLAMELNGLTVQEREVAMDHIHGVASPQDDAIEASPERLQSCLEELDSELKRTSSMARKAYDRATFLAPHRYNHNHNHGKGRLFVLNFLRSVQYDTEKAANKIVNFFQVKEELFGADSVGRSITLELDFTEQERAHMKQGGCQPLPSKDRSGRYVLFISPMLYDWAKANVMFKKMFYTMVMLAEQDQDFSRNGLVTVFYFIGGNRLYPTSFAKLIAKSIGIKVLRSMPFYDAAKHACYDKPELKPILYVVPKIAHAMGRVRFQAHYGSHVECLYKLKSYGIPVETFPLNEGESISLNTAYWSNVLETRRQMEKTQQRELLAKMPSNYVDVPTQTDTLLGRGRPYQEHAGNILLASIIASYMEQHQAAGMYGAKNIIADAIVAIVKTQYGGRFLKRRNDDQGWEEVVLSLAREKVKYGFRTNTKRRKKQTEKEAVYHHPHEQQL